jgi:hypothetical protein
MMLAATLCGWAIQDRTVTLQYSSSRGIRPLRARGTGKCYPKQLSSPASCGLSNRGSGGEELEPTLERHKGSTQQGGHHKHAHRQDLRKAPAVW